MIGLYLFAVVAANLSVALFGVKFAVFNSFVLIGFDLIARDALHDRWHGKHLKRNMLILIASGSIISSMFSYNAARVAFASFVAFMLAGLTDSVTYSALFERPKLIRMNGSNIPSAIVDSFVFITLAFGLPIPFEIVAMSIVAKITGGAFWSVVVRNAQAARK